ncbi:MAG: HXXEE domain-containing protein [Treponema sp.]|nr:HXXEE domain-containing protein [Treponema sp.]
MKEYVWLFPIIFMFHDMEEIIGFKFFLKQNEAELKKRFPFILKRYAGFSTEGFALAVYEELILCILISALAYFFDCNILWYIWLGAFLGCDLHFFIHLIQVSIYRRYIPASITSLICLPVNTLIICKCILSIEDSALFAGAFMLLGACLVFVNIFIAQKLMGWFTNRMRLF